MKFLVWYYNDRNSWVTDQEAKIIKYPKSIYDYVTDHIFIFLVFLLLIF